MSEQRLIESLTLLQGQSQSERHFAELSEGYIGIDERSSEELLLQAAKLAELVRYYQAAADAGGLAAGDWRAFFAGVNETTAGALVRTDDGNLTPHLALLTAFHQLYRTYPQEHINRLPSRHLDFFYEQVLRFRRNPSKPDRAHVVVELKKNASPQLIGPQHEFEGVHATAGKLTYRPVRDTVVGAATIASLRSVLRDRSGGGRLTFAPVADSADGFGAPLTDRDPSWPAFGTPDRPDAQVGFALSSPVLRMREGSRTVALNLTVDGIDPARFTPGAIGASLSVFVTGEKSWLGPFTPVATITGGALKLEIVIPADQAGVVDHDPTIHATSFAAGAPVLQVLLKAPAALGYEDFRRLTVTAAQIEVGVQGVGTLELENDLGPLNPSKTFLPFGPRPAIGSRFVVRGTEALSKKLLMLKLSVEWQGAPASFVSHYANYGLPMAESYYSAAVEFHDGASWSHSSTEALFHPREAGVRTFTFTSPTVAGGPAPASGKDAAAAAIHALHTAGSVWAKDAAKRRAMASPVLTSHLTASPATNAGSLVLTFTRDSPDEAYRQKTIALLMAFAKSSPPATLVQLKEPYVPAIRTISLSYRAVSDRANLSGTTLADFADADVKFFHVGCFGQMPEHGYQRRQFSFLADTTVALFPRYDHEGELHLGIADLEAGQSVSVLFQCAEGSADPDLDSQQVSWAVLCDNYWRPLGVSEVFGDTTRNMRASGVVTFVIPPGATTSNSIMPLGYIWIRGGIGQSVAAACRLISVEANAVELALAMPDPPPAVLIAPNPAGTVTKLRTVVPLVKGIRQRFATFGGAPAETPASLRTRAAERLRHKDRAVTRWDYERMILGAFPSVHRVKCIPHAKEGSWLAPGNVLVIVVPDLRNQHAIDPLQPKVDAQTIELITEYVGRRAGMGLTFKVRNPSYRRVRFEMKVRLHPGYEFNYYSALLNDDLIGFLSPWTHDDARPISFGGKVYKSVVIDFVEERPYVDYITDLRMLMPEAGPAAAVDHNQAQAGAPDEILVSDYSHLIGEAE